MPLYPVVRPPALRAGDCIGLAAPASSFNEEEFHAGVRVLQDLGFRVHYTPRLFDTYRYLAGSDTARAAELNTLFANPAIQAIFCCRGGYGSQRLLPYLDTAVITAHPKIFVGCSDLTSLLLYLYSQCHLVTLHGGSASAHSDGKGLGTTITVRLPLPAAAQESSERPNDAPIRWPA